MILYIICISYFVLCIEFDNISSSNTRMITCILLLIQLCYFFISTFIFYSWYILANSLNAYDEEENYQIRKMKKYIIGCNVLFAFFMIITCFMIITKPNSDKTAYQFVKFAESVWCIILCIVSLLSILYGYCVGEVLILTTKISADSRYNYSDEKTTKKLLFINGCITMYFLIQFGLSLYFTISDTTQFNIIYHIINISINLLFIILLCWKYREPMRKLIKLQAGDEYHNYHNCGCCMSRTNDVGNEGNQRKGNNDLTVNNAPTPKALEDRDKATTLYSMSVDSMNGRMLQIKSEPSFKE